MDHVQDRNRVVLNRVAADVELPEFVQTLAIMTPKEASRVNTRSFGDPALRAYPICSKGDTWLSLAYFNRAPVDSQKRTVRTLIDKAASFWQISEEDLAKAAAPLEKTAAAEAPLCRIQFRAENGDTHTADIRSAEDLTAVASHLLEKAASYTFSTRSDAARQVLCAGLACGQPLDLVSRRALQKMACFGIGSLERARAALNVRKALSRARHLSMDDRLDKVAGILEANASEGGLLTPDWVEKTAEILDRMDRALHLQDQYTVSGAFRRPEDELVSLTQLDLQLLEKHATKLPDGTWLEKASMDDEFEAYRSVLNSMLEIEAADAGQVEEVLLTLPPVVCTRVMKRVAERVA